MSALPRRRKKLSLAKSLSRLAVRPREPEWRRYGTLLLIGKAMGVGVVLVLTTVVSGLFFARVYAAAAEVKGADIVNPMHTVWTLIAAFLVFGRAVAPSCCSPRPSEV
jgi:Amt family ammonium transporter